jgi:hypothetical protein
VRLTLSNVDVLMVLAATLATTRLARAFESIASGVQPIVV